MGGGVSLPKEATGPELHVFPIYYIENANVTDIDANLANECWSLIINDKAQGWLKVKDLPEFDDKSALAYFYEKFYDRLFTASPSSKALFKNSIEVQGKALVHMIGAAVSLLNNLGQLVPVLKDLATRHSVAYKGNKLLLLLLLDYLI
jgi:hypothetical protein